MGQGVYIVTSLNEHHGEKLFLLTKIRIFIAEKVKYLLA
jgi:hypothetical protein